MLMTDLVGIFKSGDRDRLAVVAEELRRSGVSCVLLPSDRAIATWHIEVSSGDTDAARAVIESVRVP